MFKSLKVFLAATVFFIFSCNISNEEPDVTQGLTIDPPSIPTQASLYGQVTDNNGLPISDVMVQIDDDLTVITDENGYYSFKNVELNQLGSTIKVEAEGFFPALKFVQAISNSKHFVPVTLVEKKLKGLFDTSSDKTIELGDGAQIKFESGSIAKENGDGFNGIVKVYAHWMNPSLANTFIEMPGDLRAFDNDQSFKILTTYGMIAVELEDEAGSKLNIASGETAELIFPLSQEFLDSAPSQISLWFFDQASGYWIEEGVANLEGNKYVGEVSHFTFWNCDVPSNFIKLSGTIKDRNGNFISSVLLEFINSEIGKGHVITDINGNFKINVPKNKELVLNLRDHCGNFIEIQQFDGFDEDTNIGNVLWTNSDIVYVSGSVFKCDGAPITDGYLKVTSSIGPNFLIESDDLGLVSFQIPNCEGLDVLTVQGIDKENFNYTTPKILEVEGGNLLDFGMLHTCGEMDEYLVIEYENGLLITEEIGMALNGTLKFIGVGENDLNVNVELENNIEINQSMTPLNASYFVNANANTPSLYVSCENEECEEFSFTFTKVAHSIGEYFEGSFEGRLSSPNLGTSKDLAGNFKVIRNF